MPVYRIVSLSGISPDDLPNCLARQARSLRDLRRDLSRQWKLFRPNGPHRRLAERLMRQVDDALTAINARARQEAS